MRKILSVLFLVAVLLTPTGCKDGCQLQDNPQAMAAIRVGSSALLSAAPGIVRLSDPHRKQWFTEPLAEAFEAWTPTAIMLAESAMTKCIDPGEAVEKFLTSLAETLVAFVPPADGADASDPAVVVDGLVSNAAGGPTDEEARRLEVASAVVDIARGIVVPAIDALWPYPVGAACPLVYTDPAAAEVFDAYED